jgi:hypothetical protein
MTSGFDRKDKSAYTASEMVKALPIGRTKLYEEVANGNLVARKLGILTWSAFSVTYPLSHLRNEAPAWRIPLRLPQRQLPPPVIRTLEASTRACRHVIGT